MRARALAVAAACMVSLFGSFGTGVARADTIDDGVQQLSDASRGYKVRLAAALALSKSKDARAVIALADALSHDEDATIRRVSALALEKMIDARTDDDARGLAIDALDAAVTGDTDNKVRETAARAVKQLARFRRSHARPGHGDKPGGDKSGDKAGDRPDVFVNIEAGTDQTKKAPTDAPDRLTKIVRLRVEKTGYATSWPGGLPTGAELSTNKSRAFIIASTVKKLDITRVGNQTQVMCTVAIRVAPWSGTDGGEKWEANKAASATGSAKAMTGNSDREVKGGVRDCLEAVAEDVAGRQVVPFLKRLAQAGS